MKHLSNQLKSKTNIICVLFTVLTALGVVGALLSQHLHLSGYSRPMLILASTSFVLIALVAGIKNRSSYGSFVLIALILCWFGDYLGFYNFRASLLAFLLAHLSFIAAFWFHGIDKTKCLPVLVIFLFLSIGVFYWIFPFIPKEEQIFAISYTLIITAMVVLAGGTRFRASGILIFIAAVLFYISDIFVARWKFVNPSSINAFFCYPLYYTSCVLFALSIIANKQENIGE